MTLIIVVVVIDVTAAVSVLNAESDSIGVGFEPVLSAVVLTTVGIVFALLTDTASAIVVLLMHES